jgi:peroxiredoxin family protein
VIAMEEPLSLVLFSGTDDKLHAAGTLAAGACAMGRPVNILLQYWALDAFRAATIEADHGLAFDAIRPGSRQPPAGSAAIPWLETFRMAKELGEVTITACSGSLEVLGISAGEMDDIVDGAGGIASFLLAAEGGQIVFI